MENKERDFILPILCNIPETECHRDKLKRIAIGNFFNIISTLRNPTQFPNIPINNLMISLTEYIKRQRITITADDTGSIIRHSLNEDDDTSVLFVPIRLDYLFKTRPTEILSQIVYAAGELVLWEQSKIQLSKLSPWQICKPAIAYEAELLLTLTELSDKNQHPLTLNDSQKTVLTWYPQGLKSLA